MNAKNSRDRLWKKRLHALSAVWPEFLDGRADGLHKTRVASRRIREALPVVAVDANPAKVRKLRRKMRDVTRHLGPLRELDVELHMLEDEAGSTGAPRSAVALVRREVAARRQALGQKLDRKRPVANIDKLIKKLERVAEAKSDGKPKRKEKREARTEAAWRGALGARLLRRAKALDRALDEAGSIYVAERLHSVRISVKKLRYALEIASEAGESHAAVFVRMLKKHQDRLGRLNDIQALLKHVREAETSPSVGSRVSDLTNMADSLERDCRGLHAEFVEHRDELEQCVKAVRHQLVPALTTPPRRQARVDFARPVLRAASPAR